jgi:hypothetical protein
MRYLPTVSASVSFHNVRRIDASTSGTAGAPLTLTLVGPNGADSSLTIFTDNPALTTALINAINTVMASNPYREPTESAQVFRLIPADYRE